MTNKKKKDLHKEAKEDINNEDINNKEDIEKDKDERANDKKNENSGEDRKNGSEEVKEENPQENDKTAANSETNPEEEELSIRYLRLQADFQNYRKRMEREREATVKYAGERLVIQLLDILDNFERALESEKEHDSFYDGMDMIYQQFKAVLEKNGLEEVEADGTEFDHNLHNAVLTEESDEIESGHIISALQKGYKLNGKLIRPAMVKVAK